METKICCECGRELPVSEFNKRRSNPDGLQDRCRECFSKYNKMRYASDRERFRESVKKYREENPNNELETRLKVCKKNPTQKNSYKAVDAAIRAGVLTRPHVCSACGCPDTEHRIEAHHFDYADPLNVIWLCSPCHSKADQRRREREQGQLPKQSRRKFAAYEDEVILDRADAIGVPRLAELLGRNEHSVYSRLKLLRERNS